MPIFMIIVLDVFIIMRFSINCSTVICSPTILFTILGEASGETYAPRVYFPSYKFAIYNISFRFTLFAIFYSPIYKPEIPKIFTLSFIYLYQISLLHVTVKGLTTPLSRWVEVVWLFVQVFDDLCVVSYWIDTLILKLREILSLLCYITLSSSREKPMQAQEVAGRISGAVAGEIYAKSSHTEYPS